MLWLLRPRWLATHVLLLASVVAMVLLGHWQWDVGRRGGSGEGSLLNYGYALQWWVFCGFAVFLWTRFVRDERGRRLVADGRAPASSGPEARRERAETPKPAPYRGYAMPQMAQVRETDPDLAAYNAYLTQLDDEVLNPVTASPATSEAVTSDIGANESAAEGER